MDDDEYSDTTEEQEHDDGEIDYNNVRPSLAEEFNDPVLERDSKQMWRMSGTVVTEVDIHEDAYVMLISLIIPDTTVYSMNASATWYCTPISIGNVKCITG